MLWHFDPPLLFVKKNFKLEISFQPSFFLFSYPSPKSRSHSTSPIQFDLRSCCLGYGLHFCPLTLLRLLIQIGIITILAWIDTRKPHLVHHGPGANNHSDFNALALPQGYASFEDSSFPAHYNARHWNSWGPPTSLSTPSPARLFCFIGLHQRRMSSSTFSSSTARKVIIFFNPPILVSFYLLSWLTSCLFQPVKPTALTPPWLSKGYKVTRHIFSSVIAVNSNNYQSHASYHSIYTQRQPEETLPETSLLGLISTGMFFCPPFIACIWSF